MNKSMKQNLILLGAFAILFANASIASAGYISVPPRYEPAFTVIPAGPDYNYVSQPPKKNETVTMTTTTTVIQPVKPLPKETSTTTVIKDESSNLPPVVTSAKSDENSNDLAALSVRGSGGFMPNSVWQWLLVILLILAIVIIARAMNRSSHASYGAHAH